MDYLDMKSIIIILSFPPHNVHLIIAICLLGDKLKKVQYCLDLTNLNLM